MKGSEVVAVFRGVPDALRQPTATVYKEARSSHVFAGGLGGRGRVLSLLAPLRAPGRKIWD